MSVALRGLPPAQYEAWCLLLRLGETNIPWTLIGGQLILLLATEHDAILPRVTFDADVVVDVRAEPRATELVSNWLREQGLQLDGTSPDGVGHRFSRPAALSPGRVIVDVLAPDHLGPRTKILTVPPARTVQAPGSRLQLSRSETIAVVVAASVSEETAEGVVHRPDLLAALIGKAAATGIPGRQNPERDWEDAALLLSLVTDPLGARAQFSRRHQRWLRRLRPLTDGEHRAWQLLEPDARRRGVATARLILDND